MPGPGPGLGPRGARGFLTEDEKANMPKVTWDLIRRILSYLTCIPPSSREKSWMPSVPTAPLSVI